MSSVEFKEKTFESYFVSELSKKTRVFYCPDQRDEKYLGFDAMFYIPHSRHFFTGAWLKGITPNEVNAMGKEFNRVFPNMKANLFFQFKRPKYLTRPNAKEWNYWSDKYFRFSLYKDQHEILIKLSDVVSRNARVLYAAPKLTKTDELINAVKRKMVIKNTQLVEASGLAGHKKCTYSSNSNKALGHSEPEEITTFMVENFLQEIDLLDGVSFTQKSKQVGTEIKEALAHSNDAKDILHSARSIETDGWTDEMPQEFQNSWLDHLITVKAFSKAFGITTCFLS